MSSDIQLDETQDGNTKGGTALMPVDWDCSKNEKLQSSCAKGLPLVSDKDWDYLGQRARNRFRDSHRAYLMAALDQGKDLLDVLYGGDVGLAKSHNPHKGRSLDDLAERHGVSSSWLHGCLSLFLNKDSMPPDTMAGLGFAVATRYVAAPKKVQKVVDRMIADGQHVSFKHINTLIGDAKGGKNTNGPTGPSAVIEVLDEIDVAEQEPAESDKPAPDGPQAVIETAPAHSMKAPTARPSKSAKVARTEASKSRVPVPPPRVAPVPAPLTDDDLIDDADVEEVDLDDDLEALSAAGAVLKRWVPQGVARVVATKVKTDEGFAEWLAQTLEAFDHPFQSLGRLIDGQGKAIRGGPQDE